MWNGFAKDGAWAYTGLGGALLSLLTVGFSRTLGEPLWAAVTHPIMAAVWAGLVTRSLFHRFIRRRLV